MTDRFAIYQSYPGSSSAPEEVDSGALDSGDEMPQDIAWEILGNHIVSGAEPSTVEVQIHYNDHRLRVRAVLDYVEVSDDLPPYEDD